MTTMIFICRKIKNQTKNKQTIIESFWLPYQNWLYKSSWMGILERVLESSIKKKKMKEILCWKRKKEKKKKNA